MDVNIWAGILTYLLTVIEIILVLVFGYNNAKEPYADGREAEHRFMCKQRALAILFIVFGLVLLVLIKRAISMEVCV